MAKAKEILENLEKLLDEGEMDVDDTRAKTPAEVKSEQLEKLRVILIALNTRLNLFILKNNPDCDLTKSNVLGGVFASYMNYARKVLSSNTTTAATTKAKLGEVAMLENKDTYATFHQHCVTNEYFVGFDWKFLMPYINNWTSFKLYLDEARLGLTTWQYSKNVFTEGYINQRRGGKRNSDGQLIGPTIIANQGKDNANKNTVKVRISNYGLDGAAIPFLRGITIKPERRSGMLKTMGPLALAINLYHAKDYKEKIQMAFEESIAHIPMSKNIAMAIARETNDTAFNTLLKTLTRVLVMTTDRSTVKVHFPTFFFLIMPNFKFYDMSGKGAHFYYKHLVSIYPMTLSTASDSVAKAQQYIFHGIFTTYTDDLGLLEAVTNIKPWFIRQDLNELFVKQARKNLKVDPLPQWTFMSKMKSSNITNFGTGSLEQTTSAPTMSGFQRRIISDDVMKFVNEGTSSIITISETAGLNNFLHNHAIMCGERFRNGNERDMGTTKWATNVVFKEKKLMWEGESDQRFALSGKLFFVSNKRTTN